MGERGKKGRYVEDKGLDVGKDKGKRRRRLCMFVVVGWKQFKGWCIVMPGTASCKSLVD